MASPANPSPYVDFRWFGLLLAVASMHCQVKNAGLAGATGGSTAPSVDAQATGGQGPDMGAGGAQGSFDLGIAIDLGVADAPAVGGGDGSPGWDGGTGATDSATTAAFDGSAPESGPPARGGSMGSGGSTGGAGMGGGQGSGGVTGLGGSIDAEGADVDVESPDSPAGEDIILGGADTEPEDAGEPDLGEDAADDLPQSEDAPSEPDDVADAPPDAVTIDSRPALTLLWRDEFDGDANSGVDTTKWSYVTWPPGQINNEKQRYTASRQNVFLDGNGHLVIRALRSALQQYTSGRIETDRTFKFGRIEVRAKLPVGQGSFPGIIMLGSGTWPQSGEIALMEQYGQPNQKSWFYSSAYADSSTGSGDKRNIRYDFPDATTASADFHVYSADWHTDHIVFQVDGNEIMRTSFATTSPFYSTPEYIVLDVALGGDMGGIIDPSAFQGDMMDLVVDYVRVYSF